MEYYISIIIAIIAFLLYKGFNIIPLLFFGVLFSVLFIVFKNNSMKIFNNIKSSIGEISFNEIGGQTIPKKELIEALDFVKDNYNINDLGIRPLKGILLVGPPGTGKTLLAKAAANYIDSVFISVSGSEFIEMYAGVGAQRVRKLFERAKNMAKNKKKNNAVIFIDELEVLAGKRGKNSSHLEYDQTLNQLLIEMDGLNSNNKVNILIIAATNRYDILDDAILRPGRFDRIVKVNLPNKEERLKILKIHTKNKPLQNDIDLELIAKESFGFSGAHLESLANEAAILALRENKKFINNDHFNNALDKILLGEKLDKKPEESEIYRTAVHEVGHAFISEKIKKGSVSLLTVIPRNNALGYMKQSVDKEKYLYTKDYMEDRIAVMIAGAIAEQIMLGNKSTGATNDYQKVLDYSKKIVFSGLSELGIVDKEIISQELLYETIKKIIKTQERKVEKYIFNNKSIIIGIVNKLIKEEVINGDDFRSLIKHNSS